MKGKGVSGFGFAAGFAALFLCACLAMAPIASASAQTPIATAELPNDLAAVLSDNLRAGGSVYHAEVYGPADGLADSDGAIVLTLLSKDLRSGKDVQIVLRAADRGGDGKVRAEFASGRYFRPVPMKTAVERPVAEAIAVVQRE